MLFTRRYSGSRTFESAYRVFEFRRLLPKTGLGRGLVQFWGDHKRRYRDDDGSWSPWTAPAVADPDRLCTVEIDDIVTVADPRRH